MQGGSSPPPFLRDLPLDPACRPFSNICFSSPLFCSTPFSAISDSSPTLTQPTPALNRHSNLPYTCLNKYQKGDFTSSTVTFCQKSIFDFSNPFTNITGYLHLWDIFRFIFRQLRVTLFHKIMVAEKKFFS